MPKPKKSPPFLGFQFIFDDEQRTRLHQHLDNMLDGPGDEDWDTWSQDVIKSLGEIFDAAHCAFGIQEERINSGRPRKNLNWREVTRGLDKQKFEADRWLRYNGPNQIQLITAEILSLVSSETVNPIIYLLYEAMQYRIAGDWHPLIDPLGSEANRSSTKQPDSKSAKRVTILRALCCREYLIGSGHQTAAGASEQIAGLFNRTSTTIEKGWKSSARKWFGAEEVQILLNEARQIGKAQKIKQSGGDIKKAKIRPAELSRWLQKMPQRKWEAFETEYGLDRLKNLSEYFREL